MDIELATTEDILEELHRREIRFAFVGLQNTNLKHREVHYACQGATRDEMLKLIRMLYRRVKTTSDVDAVE